MLDIDYSLWNSGAATGRQDEKYQCTANETSPHRRMMQGSS
jgi:hypothetical protein